MTQGKSVPGIVIAAPASGSGKTVVTLGILRALANRGGAVCAAKTGPDYIDPAFQAAACGRDCINLDPWAMARDDLHRHAGRQVFGQSLLVCEGVMGLFDGAASGTGSTADLAAEMGWPVVLVIDVKGQAASAAALIAGFARFRDDVTVAGVILNRVGSDRHIAMIRDACARHIPDIPIIGALRRDDRLFLPERHLGLVQANEHQTLDDFLDQAANCVERDIDLAAFCALAGVALPASAPTPGTSSSAVPFLTRQGEIPSQAGRFGGHDHGISLNPAISAGAIRPLGRHIAVARDVAFSFVYPHVIDDWRASGAVVSYFSPLADQAPDPDADALYLPGGYPELHAPVLAVADRFRNAVRAMAAQQCPIYGECGGYMVLGRALIDAAGDEYPMLDLLPLVTSFARRKLHLGYRDVIVDHATPFGPAGLRMAGHEFHYASTVEYGDGTDAAISLGHARTATGDDLGVFGLMRGAVFGSFFHMIAMRPDRDDRP